MKIISDSLVFLYFHIGPQILWKLLFGPYNFLYLNFLIFIFWFSKVPYIFILALIFYKNYILVPKFSHICTLVLKNFGNNCLTSYISIIFILVLRVSDITFYSLWFYTCILVLKIFRYLLFGPKVFLYFHFDPELYTKLLFIPQVSYNFILVLKFYVFVPKFSYIYMLVLKFYEINILLLFHTVIPPH